MTMKKSQPCEWGIEKNPRSFPSVPLMCTWSVYAQLQVDNYDTDRMKQRKTITISKTAEEKQ